MRNISIKEIIEFRNKSEVSKKTFALNLKKEKEKNDSERGGDYWITSLSAISNAFKHNDNDFITDKINELEEKCEETDNKRTKDMYERNISILYRFQDFDFNKWIPQDNFTIIKKHKYDKYISVKGLQIKILPHHVFTFEKDGESIGAIWFIAKLGGYKESELAMFTDLLYRYLILNFSKEHNINPEFCITVDLVKMNDLNYSQIKKEQIPMYLETTIEEIKKII